MNKSLELLWQLEHLEVEKKKLLSQKALVSTKNIRMIWDDIQLLNKMLMSKQHKADEQDLSIKTLENQLADIYAQMKQSETALYGGKIKHSKELEQAAKVYDGYKNHYEQTENELLKMMTQAENLNKEIQSLKQEIEGKKLNHINAQKAYAAKIAEFDGNIEAVDTKIQYLLTNIEEELLATYRMLSKKTPMPVAKLENGICTGCRMCVPTGKAVRQNSLMRCESCGRILIV